MNQSHAFEYGKKTFIKSGVLDFSSLLFVRLKIDYKNVSLNGKLFSVVVLFKMDSQFIKSCMKRLKILIIAWIFFRKDFFEFIF